jgi:mRNA-degrading endonuclease toxin of MazEF toxin-antitoxin module
MKAYSRGDVLWHPAPFRDGGRPYIVLSDETHPFYGEEYMVVGVTTTERNGAIELAPEAWAEGGAPKRSWASPWYILTLKHATVTDRLGQITPEATDQIARKLTDLIGLNVE